MRQMDNEELLRNAVRRIEQLEGRLHAVSTIARAVLFAYVKGLPLPDEAIIKYLQKARDDAANQYQQNGMPTAEKWLRMEIDTAIEFIAGDDMSARPQFGVIKGGKDEVQ